MKKLLYFDVETTGTNPDINSIIQFSGMIEVDNQIQETFDIKMRPFNGDFVDPDAMKVHGYTIDVVDKWLSPYIGYQQIIELFKKYVDKYNKKDKLYPCAYNGYFDYAFLTMFFKKMDDQFFGSWVNHRLIDPLPVLRMLDLAGAIEIENFKLETVCKYFGIQIKAHDALSDVKALRQIVQKLTMALKFHFADAPKFLMGV